MSEFAEELTALVRSMAESESPDRWPELRELGLVGIGVPEEAGGSGGSLGDLLVTIRELARAGIVSPIVEASTAMFAVGPTEGFDTVAITDADLSTDVLTADLGVVAYADTADRIVVVGKHDIVTACTGVGAALVSSHGLGGDPVARVTLTDAAVRRCHGGVDHRAVAARLAVARSAALLGSAAAALDLTRTHVTTREQFGAPLIAIPAVAAGLAQMAVRLRTTHAAIDRTVDVFDDESTTPQRRVAVAMSARIIAAESASHVARTAHHLHGAIGITDEYALQAHTRRLWAWRDSDLAESAWLEDLGRLGRSVDERTLWEELSA